MLNRVMRLGWLVAVSLFLTGAVYASDPPTPSPQPTVAQPTPTEAIPGLRAMVDKMVDEKRDEAAKKDLAEAQRKDLENQVAAANKRIDDNSMNMTIWLTLLTVFLAIFGIISYINAGTRAKEEAGKWLDENMEATKKRVDDFLKSAELKIDEELKKFEKHVSEAKEEVINRKILTIDIMSKLTPNQKKDLKKDNENLESIPEKDYTFDNWWTRLIAAYSTGSLDGALYFADKSLKAATATDEQIAMALGGKAQLLLELGRTDEAIAVYDTVVKRFGDRQEIALLEQVAVALFNKGVALGQQNKPDEAIAAYDEVVKRVGNRQEIALLEPVAKALFNRGTALGQQNKPGEAIAAYDDVVKRFGDRQELALLEQVANALVNKGMTLAQQGKPGEAIAAYDDVVKRFGNRQELALLEPVAKALVNKGRALAQQGKPDEAIALFDTVVKRIGNRPEPKFIEIVEKAKQFRDALKKPPSPPAP